MGGFVVAVLAGTIAGLIVWGLTNWAVRRLRRWAGSLGQNRSE